MSDEKSSDSKKEQKSGLSKLNAMHIVIIIGVIIIAAVFIAKFGFGTDLISPASGEMVIAKPRTVVTPAQTHQLDKASIVRPGRTLPVTAAVTVITTTPVPDITTQLMKVTTTVPAPEVTTPPGGGTPAWPCTDTTSDPHNCGTCGNDCYKNSLNNVAEFGCSAGKCTITTCKDGYWNCNAVGKTDPGSDGCESNLLTGKFGTSDATNSYVCQKRNKYTPGPYVAGSMNCGYCGNICRGGGVQSYGLCVGGGCQNVCIEPFLNCDSDWSNGCEQIYNDSNCGSCGAKCPSGAICNNGCCVDKADQTKKVTDSHGFLCSAEDTGWEKGWSPC